MEKSDKLKLIVTPPELESPNTFWSACPRKLEYLPEESCEQGKPLSVSKSGRVREEPPCSWWINSPEHNYCFWKYVHDKSSPDGVMAELIKADLARLFGWSDTKTHFILKESIEELTNALQVYGALELLNQLDSTEGLDPDLSAGADPDGFDDYLE